jgi:hypothetical protein
MGSKVSTALILDTEQIGSVIDVLRRSLGTRLLSWLRPNATAQLIAVIGRLTAIVQVRIILRPPSGPFILAHGLFHGLTRAAISLLLLFICTPWSLRPSAKTLKLISRGTYSGRSRWRLALGVDSGKAYGASRPLTGLVALSPFTHHGLVCFVCLIRTTLHSI